MGEMNSREMEGDEHNESDQNGKKAWQDQQCQLNGKKSRKKTKLGTDAFFFFTTSFMLIFPFEFLIRTILLRIM